MCYEANRAYCAAIGSFLHDEWSETTFVARDGLTKAVARQLFKPALPGESHTRWVESKRKAGWIYGKEKSWKTTGGTKKTHPNLVLWNDLPVAEQTKAFIFTAIVDAFAARIETQNIMQAFREEWSDSDDLRPDYID